LNKIKFRASSIESVARPQNGASSFHQLVIVSTSIFLLACFNPDVGAVTIRQT